ncbi:MAG: tetratricopeptide repeat protein [Anaerolineaceae bacterium]|nr:tetratricopeptide repeat protein [Anaerolineaceae bacterium]
MQHVQPSFDLARQETAVVKLCQLVGGLPLALELAATWTRILAVDEIVAEIQHGLDALTATLHDLPERHRSLRAVIESSWRLLAEEEQALFRKLAVFRGGFTRTAARQVADAGLPQLMALADRSFLRLDGDQRFRRHPLLLQFAQEQLAAQPEEKAQAESAHAHFFTAFVQTCELTLKGAEAPTALAELAADLENIRAAWRWGLAKMETAVLNRLVAGIGRFYEDRSRYLEGTAFFAESLDMLRQQLATAAVEQILAKVQVKLGSFLLKNGRLAEAEAILQEANQRTQAHNLISTRIDALRYLGEVVGDQGNRDTASQYVAEALSLAQANETADEDVEQKLLLLWRLGILHTDNGKYDQAQDVYDQAMALAEGLGNRLHLARLHNSIAIIANRQKAYEKAVYHWQLARDGFQAWGNDWGVAATTHNLAMAYWGLEQYDKAMKSVDVGILTHKEIGHKRGVAGGLAVKAAIFLAQGKRREARRHYNESMQLSQVIGATWLAVVSLVDVAELEMNYGNMEWAATLLFFVLAHPAALATTLENTNKLLEDLQEELPAEMLAEAETAAIHLTLDDIIAQLTDIEQANE